MAIGSLEELLSLSYAELWREFLDNRAYAPPVHSPAALIMRFSFRNAKMQTVCLAATHRAS